MSREISLFSTAPQSSGIRGEDYVRLVADAARWSERQGCRGMLIYTDNRLVDAWLVADAVVLATEELWPLVAVQPMYMHPYTVAKIVTSFAHMYDRRLFLNMVAGGFKNDLLAFGDQTPHDRRYDRLLEYTLIIKRLLSGDTVTLEGEFYTVRGLRLSPPLEPEFFPGIFISGSSDAGMAAAKRLEATAIKYPKAPTEELTSAHHDGLEVGLRVGVIAREDADVAWRIAYERFPPDRKGQLTHQLATKTSDSHWHRQLSEMAKEQSREDSPYWLVPFENYKTFCPYLVGSYDQVGRELSRYMEAGFRTFILDIPRDEEDLFHSRVVFDRSAAVLAQ